MITIIDYGTGNIKSVLSAVNEVGYEAAIDLDGKSIKNSELIVLPGVASFGYGVQNLQKSDQWENILSYKISGGPIIGICLGAHLMFESSMESVGYSGLGFFKNEIININSKENNSINQDWCLTRNFDTSESSYFFYSHSYQMKVENSNCTIGLAKAADTEFVGWCHMENCLAIQFHPEKSGKAGLEFLSKVLASDWYRN